MALSGAGLTGWSAAVTSTEVADVRAASLVKANMRRGSAPMMAVKVLLAREVGASLLCGVLVVASML